MMWPLPTSLTDFPFTQLCSSRNGFLSALQHAVISVFQLLHELSPLLRMLFPHGRSPPNVTASEKAYHTALNLPCSHLLPLPYFT